MSTIHDVTFRHALVQGTPYAAGRTQGEALGQIPEAVRFFTSPLEAKGPLPPAEAEAALRFFECHCPGLNEEIHGFADALGVVPEQVVYYPFSHNPPTLSVSAGCSQVVVMPSHSADGHLRVARNYDFNHRMTEMRLALTRIEGQAAHLGFSELQFGRYDGLNEHGLCVTMSAGAPLVPAEPGGCMFWCLIRTVLDRCATVLEALEVIEGIPLSFNLNLVVADRAGEAAVVEMASSHRAVRRIREGILVSTNHFDLPGMVLHDKNRTWNSVERTRIVRRRLSDTVDNLALRELLGTPFPGGLCAYDFSGFFGTLWSEIFDVTAGTVDICFGPPSHNPWRTFTLQPPGEGATYAALLPDVPVEPGFWRKLGPGRES